CFNGEISQVRIYNRALSAAEITANYTGNISRQGLVLEQGYRTGTANDLSGNGNNGIPKDGAEYNFVKITAETGGYEPAIRRWTGDVDEVLLYEYDKANNLCRSYRYFESGNLHRTYEASEFVDVYEVAGAESDFNDSLVFDIGSLGHKARIGTVGEDFAGYLVRVLETGNQAAGTYTATFRLRAGNNTTASTIARIEVGGVSLDIKGTDFTNTTDYQGFSLTYTKAQADRVEYKIYFTDIADIWADEVIVGKSDSIIIREYDGNGNLVRTFSRDGSSIGSQAAIWSAATSSETESALAAMVNNIGLKVREFMQSFQSKSIADKKASVSAFGVTGIADKFLEVTEIDKIINVISNLTKRAINCAVDALAVFLKNLGIFDASKEDISADTLILDKLQGLISGNSVLTEVYTSISSMIKTAKSRYGIDLINKKVTFEELKTITQPLIAYVGGDHFVVVLKADDSTVTIIENGESLTISKESFLLKWQGEIIMEDPLSGIKRQYDTAGRLIKVTSGNGDITEFIYKDAASDMPIRVFSAQYPENVVANTDVALSSWAKGYNANIQYSYDGPCGPDVRVAGFTDINTDGSGYWYCYGDYAPQESDTTYTISLWVKTEDEITIRAYTADNSGNEAASRIWTESVTVKPADGWKKVTWNPITTIANNQSKSLSFNWSGLAAGKKMWISNPRMLKTVYSNVYYTQENSLAGQKIIGANEIFENGNYRSNDLISLENDRIRFFISAGNITKVDGTGSYNYYNAAPMRLWNKETGYTNSNSTGIDDSYFNAIEDGVSKNITTNAANIIYDNARVAANCDDSSLFDYKVNYTLVGNYVKVTLSATNKTASKHTVQLRWLGDHDSNGQWRNAEGAIGVFGTAKAGLSATAKWVANYNLSNSTVYGIILGDNQQISLGCWEDANLRESSAATVAPGATHTMTYWYVAAKQGSAGQEWTPVEQAYKEIKNFKVNLIVDTEGAVIKAMDKDGAAREYDDKGCMSTITYSDGKIFRYEYVFNGLDNVTKIYKKDASNNLLETITNLSIIDDLLYNQHLLAGSFGLY
ncbi:MAG: cysteine peptidase family C39 domain-containing protein, partial [Candidatus Omnitrophota bacterium]